MPRPNPVNAWSPYMKALSAASDEPEQQGGGTYGPISEYGPPSALPSFKPQATPPFLPSTSTPPAHRIEDDKTAGTRGVTPQAPREAAGAYDPATWHPFDRARLPLEKQITTDRGELARMNAPTKTTLMDRIWGGLRGAGEGWMGPQYMAEQNALRDRVEARKQAERMNLSNRIDQNIRALSQETVSEEGQNLRARMAAEAQIAAAERLGQTLAARRDIAEEQIAGRKDVAELRAAQPSKSFEEQEYAEWARAQQAAGKPSDRMTFERARPSAQISEQRLRDAEARATAAQQRAEEAQRQFHPAIAASVVQAASVQDTIKDLMGVLAPIKDQNMPFSEFTKTAAYRLGKAQYDEIGQRIAEINLSSLTQAATVLKGMGGVRSVQALKLALQHTPDPIKDSPALMYQKMGNIFRTTSVFLQEADRYGRKSAAEIEPWRMQPWVGQPTAVPAPPPPLGFRLEKP